MDVRTSICLVELEMWLASWHAEGARACEMAVLPVTAMGRATRSPRSSGLGDQGEVAGHCVTRRDVSQFGYDVRAGLLRHGAAGAEPAAGRRVEGGRLAAGDPDALALYPAPQAGRDG